MSPNQFLKWFAVLVFLASPAAASRREYVVTVGDERRSGSEVCFYRATTAENAFSLFFSYGRVVCLPADQVLDFPPGIFHAFARHSDGFVSGFRDYFIYREALPEAGYEKLDIPLEPAAWADVSKLLPQLKPGEKLGVWIAPTKTHSGVFFPLVDGELSIMVPAGRELVPLVIRNGVPLLVGSAHTLAARERVTLSPITNPEGTDLVAWVKVDSSSANLASAPLPPAEVTVVSFDKTITPLFPLYAGQGATHTLLFFKNVPPGAAQVQVRGKMWAHAEIDVIVSREPAFAVREPVLLVAAGSLRLAWNLDQAGMPAEACRKEDTPGPQITATLSHCATAEPDAPCKPVAAQTGTFAPAGTLAFEGVQEGRYSITVQPPFSKPITLHAEVRVGDESQLHVPLTRSGFSGVCEPTGCRCMRACALKAAKCAPASMADIRPLLPKIR